MIIKVSVKTTSSKRWASLVAQRLKHLPPMRETGVQSLGWEGPLEKRMITHSSILAWRIPWTEKPSRLQFTGSQRVGHDWATSTSPSKRLVVFKMAPFSKLLCYLIYILILLIIWHNFPFISIYSSSSAHPSTFLSLYVSIYRSIFWCYVCFVGRSGGSIHSAMFALLAASSPA